MINNKDTYSISEVTQHTGFKPHVIRFYEKEFNLNIPRSDNNRRYFTTKEIEQLLHIQKLQSDGYSNKQIKDILKNKKNIDSKINIINDEVAITVDKNPNEILDISKYNDNNITTEFKNEIIMILEKYNYKNEIDELKSKIEELAAQLNNVDTGTDKNTAKDVLICENAKLKLKVKEKSYEIAELKDKLKRQEHQRVPIFQRLLKPKNL